MQAWPEQVGQTYDWAIECGRRGVDLYQTLPVHITQDPDYPLYQKMVEAGETADSGRPQVREYLAPEAGMNFVDLGCCLNLLFRGYAGWPSAYYGVDISRKTIALLSSEVKKRGLVVGGLHRGSVHDTPFAAEAFDIGACIGVLEYYEGDFVAQALREAARILKPGARLVLDIPDKGTPEGRIAMAIEAHLGRPGRYNLFQRDFEALIKEAFAIDKKEKAGPMVQYFLRREGA
jgi:SAM-dependent methyltransferase